MLLCDHPYKLVRVKLASDRLRWWDAMRFHSFLVLELEANRPRDNSKAYARLDWGADGASLCGLVSHELPLLGFEQGVMELSTALLCCASILQAVVVERFCVVGSIEWITSDLDLKDDFSMFKDRYRDGVGFWICEALTPMIVLLFLAAMTKGARCSRCLIVGVFLPILFLACQPHVPAPEDSKVWPDVIAASSIFSAVLLVAFCLQRTRGVVDLLRGCVLSTLLWMWNRAVQFSGLQFIEILDSSRRGDGNHEYKMEYFEANLFNLLLPLPLGQALLSLTLLALSLRRLRAIRAHSCNPTRVTPGARADRALMRFLLATTFPLALQLYYGVAILQGLLDDVGDGGRDLEEAVLGPFTFGQLMKAPVPSVTVAVIWSLLVFFLLVLLSLLVVAGLREVLALWRAASAVDFSTVQDDENSLGRLTSHLSRLAADNCEYDIAEFNCGHFTRDALREINNTQPTSGLSECTISPIPIATAESSATAMQSLS